MNFRRGTAVKIAAVIAAGVTLASCSSGSDSDGGPVGEPKNGGTLSWALVGETASMDPAVCGAIAYTRCSPIFGTLLRYDSETKEFVGNLAESFQTSDGKNWTLKLRPGVTFSDGTPFDAAAVAFNWDRIKDPKTLSPAARSTEGMTWIVVDPQTVSVTLQSANYQLPWQLVKGLGAIGSPTAITAAGAEVGNKPVGAGPFVLKLWTRNSQMEMTRNPTYFETGLPHLDGLITKVINSDDQRMNALRNGEINIASSTLTKDSTTAEEEGFTVYETPLVGGAGLMFNEKDPLMQDAGLRQAMLLAFDAEQINNAVFPEEPAAEAFLKPDNPATDDSLGTFPKMDLEGAQRAFDDYLKRTGKTSETVKVMTYAGVPSMEQTSQLIQAQMQKINGLTVTLDGVDAPSLLARKRNGEYQSMLGGQLSADMDALYDLFITQGSLNTMGYSNPKVDEALHVTRESGNADEVEKAYGVVNGEVSKDAPFRLWQHTSGFLFADDKVQGITAVGAGSGAAFNWEDAWLN